MAKYKDLVELDLDFGGIGFCKIKLPKGFDTPEYIDQITREMEDKTSGLVAEAMQVAFDYRPTDRLWPPGPGLQRSMI